MKPKQKPPLVHQFNFIALMLFILLQQSCQPSVSEDQNPPTYLSKQEQTFVLFITLANDKVSSVREVFTKELYPLLVNSLDIKKLDILSLPSSGKHAEFLVLFEIRDADKKGISINSDGVVEKFDVSWLADDAQREKLLKSLQPYKQDVKTFRLAAYDADASISLRRDIAGTMSIK